MYTQNFFCIWSVFESLRLQKRIGKKIIRDIYIANEDIYDANFFGSHLFAKLF